MKRHGNLFGKIIEMENLHLAYRQARKGKGWQRTVQKFEKKLEDNLVQIQKILGNKSFQTSPYKVKTIYEPKKRLIYILPFSPDRIVQHALMNILEPIWEGLFIYDSYACRQGKGIHAGSRRTMEFVRENDYCLKCDISKFYPSIDHVVLFQIIKRKIKCKNTLWLLEQIVYSQPGGKNAPIGNYTSQWFGNLYLNELDQEIKHRHKIKDYIRYCDDFLLFHNDKKLLHNLAEFIKKYCFENLKLSLSKCQIFHVKQGVDFLGYRHFRKYILLRKSTSKRIKRRLKILPDLLAEGEINIGQYHSSIASILGWIKWANAYNYRRALGVDGLLEFDNHEMV